MTRAGAVTMALARLSGPPTALPHPRPAAAAAAAAGGAGAARDPVLAVAFARLEAATGLRDPDAAARILDGLTATAGGRWLLRQMLSAGLRAVAGAVAHAPDDLVDVEVDVDQHTPCAVAPPMAGAPTAGSWS